MRQFSIALSTFTIALALSACKGTSADRGLDRTTEVPTTGNVVEVKVADIAAEPERYMGQTVSVIAEIDDILGPKAFTLDEDAILRGGIDNDLLVIGRKNAGLAIDEQWEDAKVRVTGTVGRWALMEIEREIGWDLDPQIEIERERSGAVLLATSVERLEN